MFVQSIFKLRTNFGEIHYSDTPRVKGAKELGWVGPNLWPEKIQSPVLGKGVLGENYTLRRK